MILLTIPVDTNSSSDVPFDMHYKIPASQLIFTNTWNFNTYEDDYKCNIGTRLWASVYAKQTSRKRSRHSVYFASSLWNTNSLRSSAHVTMVIILKATHSRTIPAVLSSQWLQGEYKFQRWFCVTNMKYG